MASRRTLLIAGLAGLGMTTGLVTDRRVNFPAYQHACDVTSATRPIITITQRYSQSRHMKVNLVVIAPPAIPSADLPVALLLHGRFGSAKSAAVGGMHNALVSLITTPDARPFALAAVDGGNSYWHQYNPGDDPMAMLLREVPDWLTEQGYGPVVACVGVSMGGFGALVYARNRLASGQPLDAVAAIAPALITSWPEMAKRKAFRDIEQWKALDPLRHIPELGQTPIGVWIGSQDAFTPGVREFINKAKPRIGVIRPGGHNDRLYRAVSPEAINFIGRQLV